MADLTTMATKGGMNGLIAAMAAFGANLVMNGDSQEMQLGGAFLVLGAVAVSMLREYLKKDPELQ